MTASVDVIDRSTAKTEAWLRDVAEALGTPDRHEAYRVLRGFLHTLRDRLTVEEAAQLAAQLPTFLRGVYYEGWVPARVPQRYHAVEDFLERLRAAALLHGETEASFASAAVMTVMRAHVSAGELEDVLRLLPDPIRRLLGADHA
jgi:uncharacterized protein (DUF2267 family)